MDRPIIHDGPGKLVMGYADGIPARDKMSCTENEFGLAVISKTERMLAEVETISDAVKLKKMALMVADWVKLKGLGDDAALRMQGIALRAERRMGEMLRDSVLNKGAMGSKVTGNVRKPVKDPTPTLTEIGITKRESADAQKLAGLPDAVFEEVVAGEKSRRDIQRGEKELARESKRKENAKKVESVTTITADTECRFSTIVIDPPWDWGDEGDKDQLGRAKPTYATMIIDQLLELPVENMAAKDCHIYLWITNRSLPKGFLLLEKWGFRYVTCVTWCKPSIGMGNYFRGSTEQILFGVRGSQPLKRKNAGTWFAANRGKQHSEKPEEFFSLVESCSPGPYLEMFSRKNRTGWKVWGAEV